MVKVTLLMGCNNEEALKIINETPNLTELHCSGTRLTNLPNMPNLKYLNCSFMPLTSLPDFPNLTELYCYYTPLTSLPDFPNLTYLDCDFMSLKQYKENQKRNKSLLALASIQTLGLESNFKGLKNVNTGGFNLARLVSNMV